MKIPFHRLALLATCITALAIIVLSLIPAIQTANIAHADKLNHLLAYGTLAAVMTVWIGHSRWATTLVTCMTLGLMLEAAQSLDTIGRTASIFDAIANGIGAMLGLFFGTLFERRFVVRSND